MSVKKIFNEQSKHNSILFWYKECSNILQQNKKIMSEYISNFKNEEIEINPDTNDESLMKLLQVSPEDFKHINLSGLTEDNYNDNAETQEEFE